VGGRLHDLIQRHCMERCLAIVPHLKNIGRRPKGFPTIILLAFVREMVIFVSEYHAIFKRQNSPHTYTNTELPSIGLDLTMLRSKQFRYEASTYIDSIVVCITHTHIARTFTLNVILMAKSVNTKYTAFRHVQIL
jgi:hypothetical protein